MGMNSLKVRKEKLGLKFAKACVKNEKLSDMFPRTSRKHSMDKKGEEVFHVHCAKTERLRKAVIVSMQNSVKQINRNILNRISNQ